MLIIAHRARPTGCRLRSIFERLGTVTLAALLSGSLLTGCRPPEAATIHVFRGTDYTRFVDNNQGPGEVVMRYRLGRIGLTGWHSPVDRGPWTSHPSWEDGWKSAGMGLPHAGTAQRGTDASLQRVARAWARPAQG